MRIAPDEVHLAPDPADYDRIYNGGFCKSRAYYGHMSLNSAAFSAIDNETHRRRRAPQAPFFSRKAVLAREEGVRGLVAKLCNRLVRDSERLGQGHEGGAGATDVLVALKAFAVDVLTDFAYDDCWNLLDDEGLGRWWSELVVSIGPRLYFLQMFPWLEGPSNMLPLWIAARFSPVLDKFANLEKVSLVPTPS